MGNISLLPLLKNKFNGIIWIGYLRESGPPSNSGLKINFYDDLINSCIVLKHANPYFKITY